VLPAQLVVVVVHRHQVPLQRHPVGPDPVEARVWEVVPGCREDVGLQGVSDTFGAVEACLGGVLRPD
jgi:hypothetical protein